MSSIVLELDKLYKAKMMTIKLALIFLETHEQTAIFSLTNKERKSAFKLISNSSKVLDLKIFCILSIMDWQLIEDSKF